ncbi:hypothetical protein JCM8097_009557 [Rhodosporidiobolus ruineniae]
MSPSNPDKLLPIDRFGRCAATRLLQAKLYGNKAASSFMALCTATNEQLGLEPDLRSDLHDVKHDTQTRLDGLPWTKPFEFELLLYEHELYTGFSRYYADDGWLLWADKSLRCFLLLNRFASIECGNPGCSCTMDQDLEGMLRLAAARLLNLVTYLNLSPSGPLWVRASFTSPECPIASPPFYYTMDGTYSTPIGSDPFRKPPVVHLTPGDTPPLLTANDLVPLDCLLRRADFPLPSPATRDKVLRTGKAVELPAVMVHNGCMVGNMVVRRKCAGCKKELSMDNMHRCSGCRMTFYCTFRCQKKGWKEHKARCMPKS